MDAPKNLSGEEVYEEAAGDDQRRAAVGQASEEPGGPGPQGECQQEEPGPLGQGGENQKVSGAYMIILFWFSCLEFDGRTRGGQADFSALAWKA